MWFASIDWSKLVGGLSGAFESGVGDVLGVVGVIFAAFVVFGTFRWYLKGL